MQTMILFSKHKRLFSLLRFSLSSSSLSSSTSEAEAAAPKSQFVTDYLMNSCGFSPEKAATASKYLNFTSPLKPDSVRHFLKHHAGLTDAHINSIISRDARILTTNIGRTMEPNLEFLHKITTWSDSDVHRLIVTCPTILLRRHAISRLEFWKHFLNGDMKKLLLAVKGNFGLLCHDVDKGVAQKVALLKEYGYSETHIESILVNRRGFFCRSVSSIEVVLKRVVELGLPRGSLASVRCVLSLHSIGRDAFDAKMEFFKGYGWSEKEFLSAFLKGPTFVNLSEEKLREKMDFWVGEARCEPSYIASRPLLLMLSLEKRLIPRFHVMNVLASRNLLGEVNLYYFMCIPESDFINRFIHENKDVPELHDIYIAACAS